MAFQTIPNVKISGITACVPKNIEKNIESIAFTNREDAEKFIKSTGIIEKRVSSSEITSADLCFHAAEDLIANLNWNKEEIDCLIFITQTPDYVVPATSCVLQHRLGLSKECHAFDISLGCSAWTYGLSIMGSLVSTGNFKKALLLVGETTTKTKSKTDRSTYPLFGDAGSATAIEFDQGGVGFKIHSGTDGSKFEAIHIPDGGFRNPTNLQSLETIKIDEGIVRNKLQYIMDGAAVFTFTISAIPKSIAKLMKENGLENENIDYLILHQANKMIVDKVSKKVKFEEDRVPTSYESFGNTSCASIPLTMVHKIRTQLSEKKLNLIACGFGSGLSWASVYFETDKIVCSNLIEI
ncbi:3-oxoacyl-ACP synthase III family protein [Brumimicrobium mesophilum]|uniref:3-oxoacyl-ACP synthase III family protein n=1 Tax=Brumimicrobium mesophilum TaxID=392717 RepID=UPI000D144AC3|nr:ketoacyl-ACP synthase III [Brumimicrobium mesophilum]